MRLNMLIYIWLAIFAIGCSDKDTDPEPAMPKLTAQDLVVDEKDNDYNVIVDFRLDKETESVVSGVIQTSDVTAEEGEDYRLTATQFFFQPGERITSVTIEIFGDDLPEGDETFKLIVTEINGAVIETSEVEVTITDDDVNTELTIPESGYTTPESYDGMTRIWQDEFDGPELNEEYWTYEIGNGSGGWGNNESQFYRKENTSIFEGHLVIEARRQSFSGFQYTSSRIITRDKFDFKYGRVDIRAALPFGQGIWPALWMLGSNFGNVGWPACGEIDIMEMIGGNGREKTVHGTAHWEQGGHASYGDSYTLTNGDFQNEFHVFSIEWDETSIKWYVDDQLYNTLDTSPSALSEFRGEHFFIMNVAVGGNWPGYPDGTTVFPQRMIVDYIRVFQPE